MSSNQCTGNPTFNEVYGGAISEWPENLPGFICKTPPIGHNSAERFAKCCSGTVYNITSPTTPDDPAYPVSCATLCQIDPAFDANNPKNPYHWSDAFMCLLDGDIGSSDSSGFEVVCDTVTVPGKPAPTSFSSTPSGSWMTKSYLLDDHQFPILDCWGNPIPLPTSTPISCNAVYGDAATATETPASGTGVSSSSVEPTETSTSTSTSSSSSSSSSESPSRSGETQSASPTPTSSGIRLSLSKLATTLLVTSLLFAGHGH